MVVEAPSKSMPNEKGQEANAIEGGWGRSETEGGGRGVRLRVY